MVGGFFPTPYPDECLYSILCRYSVRSGNAAYESMSKLLFGKLQVLTSSVYFPIRLECVDNWASPESGITRHNIAVNHTMYPYWAITYTSEFRLKMENLTNGKISSSKLNRSAAIKSRRSWLKYLRYCPICSAEDIAAYGETYWHRKHQLQGSIYCLTHQIRLVDSKVSLNRVQTGFCSASSEVNTECDVNIFDSFSDHKDKFLKIGQENEWLLDNGLSVEWQANRHGKYLKLLRDTGIASVHGSRCDYKALEDSINDYWGNEFLNLLFEESSSFSGWFQIQEAKIRALSPLQHILLMCFLKNSIKEFVDSEPSDNPFGKEPFLCENPVCSHYHIDGATCTEVKRFNSRAVGHFFCEDCGMRYKISKSKSAKGITVITDYGHLWKNELIRCSQDKTITLRKTEEILKCDQGVFMLQKKKLGLLESPLYDTKIGPEKYYKSKVTELCEKYDEVTISLLQEKVPGAYSYLGDHDYEWLRSRIVFENETKLYLARKEMMLKKVREAVEQIMALNNLKRQITYGYIAEISGFKRDDLREKSYIRAYLNGIVESKKDWYRRRIIAAYHSNPKAEKPFTAFELCRMATIELKTYIRYQEFFEEVVNELHKT